eukprot:5401125-Heterocapsa_arctica.AAC.1
MGQALGARVDQTGAHLARAGRGRLPGGSAAGLEAHAGGGASHAGHAHAGSGTHRDQVAGNAG